MKEKVENLMLNSFFKMRGKLTKTQFNTIIKVMKWKMNYQKIHVVGTNGKGSVSKYINDNLIKNDLKTGLFTSPHILNFEERIKINNIDIQFINLQKYIIDIKMRFPEFLFGFFDLMFLSSLAYFEENNVDIVVFEAGIGAKKDIVNYLSFDITIFTSFSIDHEQILGEKIDEIIIDKSFAIKKKNIVYFPNNISKKAENILLNRAKLLLNENLNKVPIKTKNIYEQNKELAKWILAKEFNIKETIFINLPGRVEKVLINNFECYLDVSHNEDGITKTLEYFESQKVFFDIFIVSLSKDKNIKNIMNKFDTNNTYVYQNKSDRALSFTEFPNGFKRIYKLSEFINKINQRVLFIGSFYFVAEIKEILKNETSK